MIHRTNTRSIAFFLIAVCTWLFVGCSEEKGSTDSDNTPPSDNAYIVWRDALELPPGSPVFDHPPASDCADATGDEAILACADKQFWRVFQRDIDDRKTFWEAMYELEERLSEDADPVAKAIFLFRRSQVAMSFALEQTDMAPENFAALTPEDLKLLSSMSSDMSAAIALDPSEPFYVTWLDTIKIATADRLGQEENMLKAVDEAWINVEKWDEGTTRSTLIASLSGTTVGLSIASGVPHRTIDLLETFECHPDVLQEAPDAICGKDEDRRSCLEFCLANSKKAPFGGPGFMYHIGEAYARMGKGVEAQRLYELSLTLPGADIWPYRSTVEDALADMNAHVATFTDLKDEETASYVVYANSPFACRFCHGNP